MSKRTYTVRCADVGGEPIPLPGKAEAAAWAAWRATAMARAARAVDVAAAERMESAKAVAIIEVAS